MVAVFAGYNQQITVLSLGMLYRIKSCYDPANNQTNKKTFCVYCSLKMMDGNISSNLKLF